MDTTEQVLPLPPHSEVLPFLPRVSPSRRVRTCMHTWHASTHGPWSHRVNVSPSSFSTPFRGGGGNKIQPFNLSSLLWLKSWPPFFFHCLFFFLWFFRSFFSIFPTSHLSLSWNTIKSVGNWKEMLCYAHPQGTEAERRQTSARLGGGGCSGLPGPLSSQSSLGSAGGVHAVRQPGSIFEWKENIFASNYWVIIQITARKAN